MGFNQKKINFGVPLVDAALLHLDFLKEVNNNEYLNRMDVLDRAIYRYDHFWLPLAAEHQTETLVAPLDIHWVWHCHMLCPKEYVKDCMCIVGVVINHRLVKDRSKALQRSEALWNQKYKETGEPFKLDLHSLPIQSNTISQMSRLSYDIKEAASRQGDFYYQVSLPHFRDKMFLQNGLLRYKKFIFLKQQNPGEFLVPCYDIDLIWHTHQLHPQIYKRDMNDLIGKLFSHDDTVNDRCPGSKLSTADLKTRDLWKQVFHESFSMYGAMYRGPPPHRKLNIIEPIDLHTFSTKQTDVKLDEVVLHTAPGQYSKFKLEIACSADMKPGPTVITLKRPKGTMQSGQILWGNPELKPFTFDTRLHNNIRINMSENVGNACCCGSEIEVGAIAYNILPLVESRSATLGCSFEIKLDISRELACNLKGRISPTKRGIVLLTLEQGRYERAVIPEKMEQMWGPIPLSHLPPGTENQCQVANHRLKNHTGQVIFTCRIIHSLSLLMSAVQVYHHDKMVAVAHLIGSDQLPLPTQVQKHESCVTLNPRANERAVLIKNAEGDWGVCLGQWTGVRKGIPGVTGTRGHPGKRGVPGSPGTLNVRFFKFASSHWSNVELKYLQNNFKLNMESMEVDLNKGIIQVNPESYEVSENLALAFSVSLLHVLCVPRPANWTEGQRVATQVSYSRGNRAVQTVPSDNMAFVLACGLLWSTPTNLYIENHHGIYACAGCGGGDGVGNFGDVSGDLSCATDGHDCAGGDGFGDGTGDGGGDAGGCGGCGGCGG